MNLYGLRVGGPSVPVPLLVSEFGEKVHAVSPEGRWLDDLDQVYLVFKTHFDLADSFEFEGELRWYWEALRNHPGFEAIRRE